MHFMWFIHEIMSSKHTAGSSHSNAPYQNENDDKYNQIENNTEFRQGGTSVEPNKNST